MRNIKMFKMAVVLFASLFTVASSSVFAATTWKISVGDGAGSAQEALGIKFAEVLAEKTGGEFEANLFLNGQLGSEQDTVNDVAIGTLEFSILASNNLTPFSPTLGILSMPYMIQSLDEAITLTQGEFGKELTENTIRDSGARILGWTYTGFRVLSNSSKPISTLADLKGLVFRVPKNEVMIATYQSWGVNPTPMAWSETFTALQQQVVDGQDVPYTTFNSMKFYEVQKYITNLHYLFLIEPIIMSESVFQDQTPEVQQALIEAGEAASQYSVEWLMEKEAAIRDELVSEQGIEITEPADGEKEWIEAATTTVWPAMMDAVGGKEQMNKALGILGRDPL